MKHGTVTVGVTLAALALASCQDRGTDRWVTTENTTVAIDWDKVNEAYRDAEGPEDFERKVNEIYEGDEIISVAVADRDDRSQAVTGFFDKNQDGQVAEDEKVFTILRTVKDESSGQYQISGHGPYVGYHSPMWDIASGMLLGSMISGWFRPSYMPVAYVTSPARISSLTTQRSAYRAANPSRFSRPKASRSGRNYGSGTPTRQTAPRRSSGGRFGVRGRRRDSQKPERLIS